MKKFEFKGSNLRQPVVILYLFCSAIKALYILWHLQCSHDNYIYNLSSFGKLKWWECCFYTSVYLVCLSQNKFTFSIKILPCYKEFFQHMYWMDFRGKCFPCNKIPHKFLILCLWEIPTFELCYLLDRFLQAGQEGQDSSSDRKIRCGQCDALKVKVQGS